jgi:hypothetical protein
MLSPLKCRIKSPKVMIGEKIAGTSAIVPMRPDWHSTLRNRQESAQEQAVYLYPDLADCEMAIER